MTRFIRLILGLRCCLIIGLIVFGEGGLTKGTLLAAESSLRVREEMVSRFRVEDEEDLHWTLITFGGIAGIGGHSISHGAYGSITDQVHSRGVELAEQGRIDQAISEFTKCIKDNPRYGTAYYNRGTAYARTGQFDLAIADFTKFIEMEVAYPSLVFRVFHNRGVAYTQKGQYEQALADFNQVLKMNSHSYDDTDMVGGGRGGMPGRLQTEQTKPQNADNYYMRGVVYLKQGQIDRAIADFDKAVAGDPNFAKAYCNRGVAYAMQGQFDRALPDLNKALSLNPKYSKARYMRGLVYSQQKRYDLALADFNKALEINAGNDKALYFRGILYFSQGRHDLALADFHQALKINPRYANAYYNRGVAYYNKSLYDKAIGDFNKSLELDPKLADAYFNKALALEASNRQTEAREAYTAFLRHAPPEAKDQIEQARRRLQQ